MNPIFNEKVVKLEIYHSQFNLDKKDNINELPESPAVYGVFGIIHDTPIHPRVVASTKNLRDSIQTLFENPPTPGLKEFMQGAWVQMLCYELLPDSSDEDLDKKEKAWIEEYKPSVKDDGEYPEYLYEWPYDQDGNLKPEYVNPPEASI